MNIVLKLKNLLNINTQVSHVYDNAKVSFAVTDRFLSLSLFFKNGTFDPRNDLVGFDSSSIKWGEDLFKHYKENSIEIKSL